ncbi:hypothetical protein [Paraburkholderia kirstenboschensis]|uniref:Transposase n=1 Tax=Paraburkholderia kirstenboschensis TaxID=1245436 RepID=A0ABZ0E8T2_9BURK|nr:hypothetical protein [Paraburkholderia kirstenboschensis]WOD13645.1 hypothetical protein RW095_06575 [Paraburkholderia kirstenboschensis]
MIVIEETLPRSAAQGTESALKTRGRKAYVYGLPQRHRELRHGRRSECRRSEFELATLTFIVEGGEHPRLRQADHRDRLPLIGVTHFPSQTARVRGSRLETGVHKFNRKCFDSHATLVA